MMRFPLKHLATAICLCALTITPSQAAESVVVTVKVFPSPGREDELQASYIRRLEYLRKNEPGATFRLLRSKQEPTTFLWYEVYESAKAYENHVKVVMPAFRKESGATPEGIIAKPSESESYIELN